MILSLFDDINHKLMTKKKMSELPISANSFKRRITNLDHNMTFQVLEDLQKADCFSVAKMSAQIVIFVRYKYREIMQEELLDIATLRSNYTRYDINFKRYNG